MGFESFNRNNTAPEPKKPEAETASHSVDWSKHFVQPAPRSEIDPEHKLSKDELVAKINGDFQKRGVDGRALGSFDIREYPELLDDGIRDLCQNINKLDFARTLAGCEGHPLKVDLEGDVPSDQVGRQGDNFVYVEPYLTLLFDNSEKSQQTMSALNTSVQSLREKYPNLSIRSSEEVKEDVTELSFNLNLSVPEAWMKTNGKKLPQELNQEIARMKQEMNVVDDPREENFDTKEEYEKAIADWQQKHEQNYRKWSHQYEFGLYWKEYGEYFDSEARGIIKEFFDSVDHGFNRPKQNMEQEK